MSQIGLGRAISPDEKVSCAHRADTGQATVEIDARIQPGFEQRGGNQASAGAAPGPVCYGRGGVAPTINFTDTGPITRETDWGRLPHHRAHESARKTVTREEPCDYRDNNLEPYYPVKTSDGQPLASNALSAKPAIRRAAPGSRCADRCRQ